LTDHDGCDVDNGDAEYRGVDDGDGNNESGDKGDYDGGLMFIAMMMMKRMLSYI